jgi:amino acid adenylation domain-containing protein
MSLEGDVFDSPPLAMSTCPRNFEEPPATAAELDRPNRLHQLSVAELVSARAQAAPDALALASRLRAMTYGELEVQSNQLAHYLLSIGVGPEVCVGLCLDRGPALVVAALAILKAGGAYVALDPDYPTERLRFMLEDAKSPVLIAGSEISARIPSGNWQVVDIDKDATRVVQCPETMPVVSIAGENLAYVIFTSGSTGRPKGVQISHESLLNLISWHCNAFSISPEDRASQLASIAFDGAVWEIWPNLVAGGSLHFPEEDTRVSPEPLRDWLVAEKITISFVPTALAEGLLGLYWPEDSALRYLLTGGDTLHYYPPSTLPFVVVNNYGPTECTVVATSGPVSPGEHAGRQPSIGRPIDNLRVYILDEQMQELPVGSLGELHIGGIGVARGYLNRPDLDAEKFVADPSHPGERLYKTGDLARYLPDGQIAFAGRIDDQIKIRGYRIEPDEIATLLDQYPGIKGSVVVAREDDSGDKRLVAYVVSSADAELIRGALQEFLKKYLPDHMVPVVFVRIPSLPITATGKVDRTALPVPDRENSIADQVPIAPSTPVEKRMAEILSELLGIKDLGINENFFLLGGHSLLGTQLIARSRDSFGIELPLRTVFDSPTVAELSTEIERMLRLERMSAD